MNTPNPPNIDDLWDYDNPAETEEKFRALLPTTSANVNSAYHAELLTQIARTHSLRQQFDEAHTLLDQVESMLNPNTQRAHVRYLLERGRTYNSADQGEKARSLFVEAWQLAKAIGEDGLAVDAVHMVANTESGQTALEWNQQAIRYAEVSQQPAANKWLGSLYNNIGWTYHAIGDYEAALESFRKAEAWQRDNGTTKNWRIAQWCIGRTLRSLDRVEEALALQLARCTEYEAEGEKPGYTYEEIGECLLAIGQPKDATPYFALAYKQLSQDPWLSEHESDRIRRLKNLGDVSD